MKSYIAELETAFLKHSNIDNALNMKKYMKNNFYFYGIKAPIRKEITRNFLRKENIPHLSKIQKISVEIWNKPEREFQYFGMELLTKYQKLVEYDYINHFEYLITTKSWWDTVDFIAVNLVSKHFLNYPELITPTTKRWVESDNIWLQRTAILFQLKYKSNTDLALLFNYINMLSDSKEFFIRKAIGWALREYSKTDPNTVINFVNSNKLSGLSKREALKSIK